MRSIVAAKRTNFDF